MAVAAEQIDREVEQRLRKLSRTVRMDGFRPGKVPLKIVAQHYGPQVRSEVIGDAVQKAFSAVVQEQKLKVAGYPRIERKEGDDLKSERDEPFHRRPAGVSRIPFAKIRGSSPSALAGA